MKTKRLFIILSLVIFLSIITLPLQASPDKENPNEDDWDETSVYMFPICDPITHVVAIGPMPVYSATTTLISTHCRTEAPVSLKHRHWLAPMNTAAWAGIDEYWDARFWDGVKTLRIENASFDHETCLEYAFTESLHATGLYNFVLIENAWETVFSNDLDEVDPGEVENGDILRYSTSTQHATLVDNAVGGHPSTTTWCWNLSGVYWMQGEFVDVDPYDTPMCAGAIVEYEYIYNQPWTWDTDYCTDPTIYSD